MNTVHEKRTPTICCLSTLSLTITFAYGIDISFFSQISVLFITKSLQDPCIFRTRKTPGIYDEQCSKALNGFCVWCKLNKCAFI